MLRRLIQKIQESLALTKNESKIIAFLAFGMLLGGVVRLWQVHGKIPDYNYRQTDEIFYESSSRVDSIISAEEETLKVKSSTQHKKAPASPIDINSASIEDLSSLPGIGKATAERIVEYRKTQGKFVTIEDLMRVKGIGEKKFQKLKSMVVVH